MGCCNEPVSTLTGTPPDPTQHVNYARGMVLGVDDFTQEFAYLSGRDRWLARDAIGYGTLSGLRVFAEDDGTEGPRVHVTAGSALVPSGRQVCIAADQCCVLDRWLARSENAVIVSRLLNPASPPLSPPLSPPAAPPPGETGVISLFLTLCWADCQTRPVPIPGEPCRSEDELMAPSRVADDYCLELREKAPLQTEEDALRDFVRWLRANVQVVDASPPPDGDDASWLAALRPAAQPWLDAQTASPPVSPPVSFDTLGDYLFDLSPSTVTVARDRLCDFLRVAFRFWVTELRPMWIAMRCHQAQQADIDCLLLARVSFEVTWIAGSPTGAWQVSGSPVGVAIDETTRPVLAHLRLLQEWMLCGCTGAELTTFYAPGGPVVSVSDGGTGVPTPPEDGQMLIGDGGSYALASMAGTPNQIHVANGAGSVVLSTPQDIDPGSTPQFAGMRTTGAVHAAFAVTTADITLDETHHFVLCDGGAALGLPKCSAINLGRIYIVKSINGDSKLVADAADTVDGPATPNVVTKGRATTLVSDGMNTWHVIATV